MIGSFQSALRLSVFAFAFLMPPMARGQMLPDGRALLKTTTKDAARFVGKIEFLDPGKSLRDDKKTIKTYQGSGALIGPKHVLTAAHVIWDTKLKKFGAGGFPPNDIDITFQLGLNGKEKIAEAKVVGIYMQKTFQEEKEKNPDSDRAVDLDIAILLLDKDLSKEVGGHLKVDALPEKEIQRIDTSFHANGYDSDQGGVTQVTRMGKITPDRGRLTFLDRPLKSIYTAGWQTIEGSSGGPVWITRDGNPVVVGVIGQRGTKTFAGRPRYTYGRGVLLDDFYIRWINAYVADTLPKSALPRKYVIRKGDSLRGLAAKFYGDEKYWSRIYEANRSTIGPNPERIITGRTLLIPE